MSDLRDITNALSVIGASLTSIEEHVAQQDSSSEQLRLGLHELRNVLQVSSLDRDQHRLQMDQIQKWMGAFARKQDEIHEMVTNIQTNLHDSSRAISQRMRALEDSDEVTQP